MYLACFLSIILTFPAQLVLTDFCGHYSVLTKTNSFYLTQKFEQTINIGFENYSKTFKQLEKQADLFSAIAQNYSNDKQLNDLEPNQLIPFRPDANLILISSKQTNLLPAECKKHGAQLLNFEPHEVHTLKNLMKENSITKMAFFGFPSNKFLHSPSLQILDEPSDPTSYFSKLGIVSYPIMSTDGTISYPSTNIPADYEAPAFCIKKNNFWDLPGNNRNTFKNTISKIISSASAIKKLSNVMNNLATQTSKLPSQIASLIPGKYIPSPPVILTKMVNFLRKFNNVPAWENSVPSDFNNFLQYLGNFKQAAKIFKDKKQTQSNEHVFNNFIISNRSLSLPSVDVDRLMAFLKLDPVFFGIGGSVELYPAAKATSTETTTAATSPSSVTEPPSMTATIKMNIFDRRDTIEIYTVKPLIINDSITSINYVTKTLRHQMASEEEPIPINCITIETEHTPICDGFQTSGAENIHNDALLACGRALFSTKISPDYEKCPRTSFNSTVPLAYRADCEDNGVNTVVLSSARPVQTEVYCDTFLVSSNLFQNFPVTFDSDCEIREKLNDTSKILLPQFHTDFLQQQKVSRISTQAPPRLTTTIAPVSFLQNPTSLILIGTIAITIIALIFTIFLLALFDPKRCLTVTQNLCCCFFRFYQCCRICCNPETCCRCCTDTPDIEQAIEMRHKVRRNNYQSDTVSRTPSAPDFNQPPHNPEILPFINPKSPAQSRRSSIHSIKTDIPRPYQNR